MRIRGDLMWAGIFTFFLCCHGCNTFRFASGLRSEQPTGKEKLRIAEDEIQSAYSDQKHEAYLVALQSKVLNEFRLHPRIHDLSGALSWSKITYQGAPEDRDVPADKIGVTIRYVMIFAVSDQQMTAKNIETIVIKAFRLSGITEEITPSPFLVEGRWVVTGFLFHTPQEKRGEARA